MQTSWIGSNNIRYFASAQSDLCPRLPAMMSRWVENVIKNDGNGSALGLQQEHIMFSINWFRYDLCFNADIASVSMQTLHSICLCIIWWRYGVWWSRLRHQINIILPKTSHALSRQWVAPTRHAMYTQVKDLSTWYPDISLLWRPIVFTYTLTVSIAAIITGVQQFQTKYDRSSTRMPHGWPCDGNHVIRDVAGSPF